MSLLAEYEAQEQWRYWDAMLDRLPLRRNQTVLDLGCGPGLVSARLAARVAHVVGIDQNEEFLHTARRRCPANCTFLQANLEALDTHDLPTSDAIWSSFTAAYFPDFAPVLERWISCLSPKGWIAIVEIDDLWTGHHPLPVKTREAFTEFAEHARMQGIYDCHMGRRLTEICWKIGLVNVSESRWPDAELASDGPVSDAILVAWQRRFARVPAMEAYFSAHRFNKIRQSFLTAITRGDHRSTAALPNRVGHRVVNCRSGLAVGHRPDSVRSWAGC
jgi:SAM-dependent methyltransferase